MCHVHVKLCSKDDDFQVDAEETIETVEQEINNEEVVEPNGKFQLIYMCVCLCLYFIVLCVSVGHSQSQSQHSLIWSVADKESGGQVMTKVRSAK